MDQNAQLAFPGPSTSVLVTRIQEVIPLLFLLSNRSTGDEIVLDLGSGTGYLARYLVQFVREFIQVDRSPAMLSAGECTAPQLVAELDDVHKHVDNQRRPNIIICMAPLRHLCVFLHGSVQPAQSRARQLNAPAHWASLLPKGGRLIIVDVGAPDPAHIQDRSLPFPQQMHSYFERRRLYLSSMLSTNHSVFRHMFSKLTELSLIPGFLKDASYIEASQPSLADIVSFQMFPVTNKGTHVVPLDFFNDVVAERSIDGHEADFLSEREIAEGFGRAGLTNTCVATVPTPWIFSSYPELLWFVHELFGFEVGVSNPSVDRAIPSESRREERQVEQYLGVWSDDVRYYLNWQLIYAYGEKM